MSKSKRRSRVTKDQSTHTDVVTQLECAVKNPHAAAIGAVIGGLVPWFGRTLAHEQVPAAWSGGHHGLAIAMLVVVLGCTCFSGISVFKFGRAAFGDSKKALGFVLALEGVMVVAHGVTSAVALAALVAINAVANGSVIALARDATRRRREADARRAETRARRRGAGASIPAPRSEAPSRTHLKHKERSVSRSTRRPGNPLVVTVPWPRATLDDVVDAEIVSEQHFLA